MTEKQLTNLIIRYVNSKYADCAFVYKRKGGSGNETGKPDITGIYRGVRIELEVKSPHLSKGSIEADFELASKLQQHYIRKFQKLGGLSGVATSFKNALRIMGMEAD
jgi:hypothetical protein